MQQGWVFNLLPPPKKSLKVVRCWWQNEGKFLPPIHGSNWPCKKCLYVVQACCICDSAEKIVKPGTTSWTHRRMFQSKLNKMAEGKSTNVEISMRLHGGFLEASRSFIYCMAMTTKMAMCNITYDRAWMQVCYRHLHKACNIWNFAYMSKLLDNLQLKWLFIILILFCWVVHRGGPSGLSVDWSVDSADRICSGVHGPGVSVFWLPD